MKNTAPNNFLHMSDIDLLNRSVYSMSDLKNEGTNQFWNGIVSFIPHLKQGKNVGTSLSQTEWILNAESLYIISTSLWFIFNNSTFMYQTKLYKAQTQACNSRS